MRKMMITFLVVGFATATLVPEVSATPVEEDLFQSCPLYHVDEVTFDTFQGYGWGGVWNGTGCKVSWSYTYKDINSANGHTYLYVEVGMPDIACNIVC